MKLRWSGLLLFILLYGMVTTAVFAEEDRATVQAILFYSPTCPHCHQVINELLLPLIDAYGQQVQVVGVDVSQEAGQYLYQLAIAHFAIPQNRLGVPTLVIGDTVLVGSGEIPAQFPALVESGLTNGGVGWPEIPELELILPDLPPSVGEPVTTEPTAILSIETPVLKATEETALAAAPVASVTPPPTAFILDEETAVATTAAGDVMLSDGFWLGGVVLLGMIGSLLFGGWRTLSARTRQPLRLNPRLTGSLHTPLLTLAAIGLITAVYLSYVEITRTAAVCGPVGECNIVQSSRYASILGIPVAVLGLLNYLTLGGIWVWRRALTNRSPGFVSYSLLILTTVGLLFSIYLTLLELFVIHAICIWCLTSAVVTTGLFILITLTLERQSSPAPCGLYQET